MYGHPNYFAETFIDPARFRGTCYRAADLGHAAAARKLQGTLEGALRGFNSGRLPD
jgi:hypothetical protein